MDRFREFIMTGQLSPIEEEFHNPATQDKAGGGQVEDIGKYKYWFRTPHDAAWARKIYRDRIPLGDLDNMLKRAGIEFDNLGLADDDQERDPYSMEEEVEKRPDKCATCNKPFDLNNMVKSSSGGVRCKGCEDEEKIKESLMLKESTVTALRVVRKALRMVIDEYKRNERNGEIFAILAQTIMGLKEKIQELEYQQKKQGSVSPEEDEEDTWTMGNGPDVNHGVDDDED